MNGRLTATFRLVAVLTVLGIFNSGCDLLSTILTAIGTCGGASDIMVTTSVDSNTGTCICLHCVLSVGEAGRGCIEGEIASLRSQRREGWAIIRRDFCTRTCLHCDLSVGAGAVRPSA
jgi:hypothetical protein